MGTIVQGFLNLYALLSILPFLSFALIWVIVFVMYHDKKKSTTLAMDVTTVLLIGSVSVMFNVIFDSGFGGFWWIVLFFLITGGVLGNLQNRLKGSVNPKKLVRVVWRVGFLLLSFLYAIFIVIGIVQYFHKI
jgi:hypothetical protein